MGGRQRGWGREQRGEITSTDLFQSQWYPSIEILPSVSDKEKKPDKRERRQTGEKTERRDNRWSRIVQEPGRDELPGSTGKAVV